MPEPSLEVLAAATALAAFVAGFLRGSLGGGIGLALTPVLTLALSAQSALGLLASFSSWPTPSSFGTTGVSGTRGSSVCSCQRRSSAF